MKELSKALFASLVSLFNVSIYNFNLMDHVDSLALLLKKNGIEHQANELLRLYELVAYHQEVLIFLDAIKCLFMLLSILFVYILNQARLSSFFSQVYKQLRCWYICLKNYFKAV